MLLPDRKYMSLQPQIPLYVSGFGPRAMELAGEYGDGLVFAIPPRGIAGGRGAGARAPRAPRAPAARSTASATARSPTSSLLEPGEAVDPRG